MNTSQLADSLSVSEAGSTEELFPLVYNELRRLAAAQMRAESPDHTLQPTALVHEAFLRLQQRTEIEQWNSRGHFVATAVQAMRRILVEQARRKKTLKRGGNRRRVSIEAQLPAVTIDVEGTLALDDALSRLAEREPFSARVAELRLIGGLSLEETAECLDMTRSTVYREWTFASAWLKNVLDADSE
ncbi:MAG: RNA polymerase subunit sigma [Planctomycetota bacterium]|nr:MAG: RNA polymerase subunit sigma [Planctomycetota bacterium]